MRLSQLHHIKYIMSDELLFTEDLEAWTLSYVATDWNSGIRVRIEDTEDDSMGLIMCGEDTDDDDFFTLSPDSDEAVLEIRDFIRLLFSQGAPGRAQRETKFLNQSVYTHTITPQDVAFRAIELYGIDSFRVSPVDHSVEILHEHGKLMTIHFDRNDNYDAIKWNMAGFYCDELDDINISGNISNYNLIGLHHVIISWSRSF